MGGAEAFLPEGKSKVLCLLLPHFLTWGQIHRRSAAMRQSDKVKLLAFLNCFLAKEPDF
jgi:hypothetical protein